MHIDLAGDSGGNERGAAFLQEVNCALGFGGEGVVEELAGLAQEEGLGVQPGLLAADLFDEHGGLGGLQHAIEAAEHSERQNDLAVFGLALQRHRTRIVQFLPRTRRNCADAREQQTTFVG